MPVSKVISSNTLILLPILFYFWFFWDRTSMYSQLAWNWLWNSSHLCSQVQGLEAVQQCQAPILFLKHHSCLYSYWKADYFWSLILTVLRVLRLGTYLSGTALALQIWGLWFDPQYWKRKVGWALKCKGEKDSKHPSIWKAFTITIWGSGRGGMNPGPHTG